MAGDEGAILQQWRADTPGCGFRNHLNNAGAALMPDTVTRAITDRTAILEVLTTRRINTVLSLREYGRLDVREKRVESAIRRSPHYYNIEEEIDAAVDTVAAFMRGAA